MTASDDTPPPDLGAHATSAAALLGLTLEPAWLGPVTDNLRVLAAAADLVAGFALPDETDAAPVFVP